MNKWIIAIMASLAAGMEILDASAVNIALSYMQGGLSAGVDEVAWVLTAYLVANAVMIPMTGWLAAYFGRKRFFLIANVAVHPDYRRQGIARKMTERLIQRLDGMGVESIWIEASNTMSDEDREAAVAVINARFANVSEIPLFSKIRGLQLKRIDPIREE